MSRIIIVFLIAVSTQASAQQCVGPKCPLYMAPMGDNGDFDKAIIICNQHALAGLQIGSYEAGFESCKDIYSMWLTSPARDKYLQDMKDKGRR